MTLKMQTRSIPYYEYPQINRNGLGWLDIAAGIMGIVATGATSAISVLGTLKQTELAEQQMKLSADLAQRRMSLEESLAAVQRRIFEIQAGGIETSQAITEDILRAKAELEKKRIELELEKIKVEQLNLERERRIAEQKNVALEIELKKGIIPQTAIEKAEVKAEVKAEEEKSMYLKIGVGLVAATVLVGILKRGR